MAARSFASRVLVLLTLLMVVVFGFIVIFSDQVLDLDALEVVSRSGFSLIRCC